MSAAKIFLEKATDLFESDKFSEAKAVAEVALEAGGETDAATTRGLKLLVRKCLTHLESDTIVTPAPAPAPAAAAAPAPAAPAAATAATAAAQPAAPAAPAKPQTTCRFEWFQTPTTITYSFYVKGRTRDMVAVRTEKRSVEVSIKLDLDKEFQLTNDPLFGEIDETRTEVIVKQPKVEVVLYKKLTGMHWSSIELTGQAAADVAAATASAAPPVSALPPTQQQLAYPNSKGRDWSRFRTDIEIEEAGKKNTLSGEDGLNSLFQQIYAQCSEENRQAMIKSFTESNGTVLSTNWADVGNRKVEGEAPKGMEMKKYQQ